MADEPQKFRNYHRCPHDGTEWMDSWSCMCNDRCPACHAEIEPYTSEELCLKCGAVVEDAENGACPECGEPVTDFDTLQAEHARHNESAEGASFTKGTQGAGHEWIVLVRRGARMTSLAYEFASESEARTFVDAAPLQEGLWLRVFRASLAAERKA